MLVRPLKGNFGVEIFGVDLKDPATHHAVVEAFHLHGAIVVRDQELEPPHQLAFTRSFGTPETNQGSPFVCPGHEEILVISNRVVDGRKIGNLDAGIGWHTDSSYLEEPVMCTMLYAMEVPAVVPSDRHSSRLFWLPNPELPRKSTKPPMFASTSDAKFGGPKPAIPELVMTLLMASVVVSMLHSKAEDS